jgi:hypothetical protein
LHAQLFCNIKELGSGERWETRHEKPVKKGGCGVDDREKASIARNKNYSEVRLGVLRKKTGLIIRADAVIAQRGSESGCNGGRRQNQSYIFKTETNKRTTTGR